MKGSFFDQNGDILHTFHYDEMEDRTFIRSVQDVDPYLKNNKEQRDNSNSLERMGDGLQKIASIPLNIIEQWRKELGSDPLSRENRGWLMKRLHSPEYAKLRTKNGRFI